MIHENENRTPKIPFFGLIFISALSLILTIKTGINNPLFSSSS
jgi:hypothetical protein